MDSVLLRFRLSWSRLKSILSATVSVCILLLLIIVNIKLNIACFHMEWANGKPPLYFILLIIRFVLLVVLILYIVSLIKPDYSKINYVELTNYFKRGAEALEQLKITDEYLSQLKNCKAGETEKIISLVWSGLNQTEQEKHRYAFDGVNDREDLMKIMEKRKVSLLSAVGFNLEEIRLWYGVNVRNMPKSKKRKAPVKMQKKENPDEALSVELVKAFGTFGVNLTPTGKVERGPAIIRVSMKLEPGVKLSKVTGLEDDIAAAMGKQSVRVTPSTNEKSVVYVEIPRGKAERVLFRELVKAKEFAEQSAPVAFVLGRGISGNVVGDLDQLPHLLIAGTTGSGKSVCMNALICSMLTRSSPERLRLIMIDPKMVELAPYASLPHLMVPVVTDARNASAALQTAVDEMMRRYRKFAETGVKKIEEYNDKHKEGFPRVVVVIDELSDLMMVTKKEKDAAEDLIVRLAQMGRAAGVHLVAATQRPSADVITGLMKSNIPSRIAFAVASSIESRIILDASGAEKLVGRGDMLYRPLGGKSERVQGAYISPEEIDSVVKEAAKRGLGNGTRSGDHGEEMRPLREGDRPEDEGQAGRTV